MPGANIPYEDRQARHAGRAYILQNQVTHARFLPTPSKHSFVYPTVSFLVSLNALESKELDLLKGWLFSYGGIHGRLTGLRASGYLHDGSTDKRSIRSKLVDLLDQQGHPGCELEDAWLMTMPSFLGLEGINPLSVYYCYRKEYPSLWLVVLEVHNTFGERHVYVLETCRSEVVAAGKNVPDFRSVSSRFNYQWTFPRQFHVSPFNDRSGHYMCQVVTPSHPPSLLDEPPHPSPRPIVKITLLTASSLSKRKLVAILRTTQSTPFSSASLLWVVACAPLGLLLAFPRILYQAYLLHYHKRLDVYQRPELCAPDPVVESKLPVVPNNPEANDKDCCGSRGVGWQKTGALERWCERRVSAYLRSRCRKTGISLTFMPSNPAEDRTTVLSSRADGRALTIFYRTPRLFTILFTMPSSQHALLFGVRAEKVFSVSSDDLFHEVFAPPSASSEQRWKTRLTRCLRCASVPRSIDLQVPLHHSLDEPITFMSTFMLFLSLCLVTLEEKLFKMLGARFVRGEEPWGGWERLRSRDAFRSWETLGSVRQKSDKAE
ncbi:hypothetical protein K439DRAFT_1652066 [Ramaria rubella]|nr:hypothetical protein K439DRAFT_1652066 [Ramaria rubella]